MGKKINRRLPTKILWSPTAGVNLLFGGCCIPTIVLGSQFSGSAKPQFLFHSKLRGGNFLPLQQASFAPIYLDWRWSSTAMTFPLLQTHVKSQCCDGGWECPAAAPPSQCSTALLSHECRSLGNGRVWSWAILSPALQNQTHKVPPHSCWSQCSLQPPKMETLLLH